MYINVLFGDIITDAFVRIIKTVEYLLLLVASSMWVDCCMHISLTRIRIVQLLFFTLDIKYVFKDERLESVVMILILGKKLTEAQERIVARYAIPIRIFPS